MSKELSLSRVLLGIMCLLLGVNVAVAQDGAESTSEKSAENEEEEEKVITGTIATTGNYGFGPTAIASGSTGPAPGSEAGAIVAGVKRTSRDECRVTISNNSKENGYSVRFRLVERDSSGREVGGKSFAASLDPEKSEVRELSCQNDTNLSVELDSARKR